VLPWDIIDGGMKDSFFRAEMAKATREEWTLPPKRQKENARLLTVPLHSRRAIRMASCAPYSRSRGGVLTLSTADVRAHHSPGRVRF
jgi:hypothetical protein